MSTAAKVGIQEQCIGNLPVGVIRPSRDGMENFRDLGDSVLFELSYWCGRHITRRNGLGRFPGFGH